jgi:hypothetical protein
MALLRQNQGDQIGRNLAIWATVCLKVTQACISILTTYYYFHRKVVQ